MKIYKTSEAARARAKARYWANVDAQRAYHRGRREIKNAQRRAWNAENRDKQRAINERVHLMRYHGLSVEQHAAMIAEQRGLCAICGEAPSGQRHCGKLHVDHDHASGAIRDLLCADCNRGLGLFRDNAAALRKAAMYLESHRAKTA